VRLSGVTGATVWAKAYGGTSGTDLPKGLTVDGSGNLLVAGSTFGASDLGGGAIGTGGLFIAKYSATDGSYVWAKAPGGAGGNGITVDPSTGHTYVTGQGTGGFFLNAYDPSGNSIWSYSNGTGGDAGYGVAVDGKGNVAITGQSQTALNFGDTWMFGSGWFVASFTVSGNAAPVFGWAKYANSSNSTSTGYGAAYDGLGHLLVTGGLTGTVNFGGTPVSALIGEDGFLAQYTK
jgi:hypothetical protein